MKYLYSLDFIAHRGASQDAPENTMAAFNLAVTCGATMIECDISFSQDEIPFIFHDDFLDRTTNGRGLVQHKTWLELQNLDAGSWFSKQFSNEKLISLGALMDWHDQHQVVINLEIKTMPPQHIAKYVAKILAIINHRPRIILSSFQVEVLQYLKICACQHQRALLVKHWSITAVFLAKSLNCIQINVGDYFISSKKILQTHAAGLKIGVYTVNTYIKARYFASKGVDAIFTDNLKLAQRIKLSATLSK